MRLIAAVALAVGTFTTALAQSGTATWQVSADNGVTWLSDVTLTAPQTVKVRLRLGWSNIPSAIAFAGSQFDAFILNTAAGDFVTDITRPSPFDFFAQSLAATPYSQGIKIDAAFDTALPGTGTGWVNPGQNAPSATSPDTSNPATVFNYTLNIGTMAGTRTIRNIFSGATGRALSVYISDAGAQTKLSSGQVTINPATVSIIPSPSVTSAGLMM